MAEDLRTRPRQSDRELDAARRMAPVPAAGQMGLAALLLFGSLALRRRARNGVSLCRLWAWLAVVWVVVTMGRAIWWLQRHAAELPTLAPVSCQGYAVFALAFAFILLLAFPVFLLVWLSKPSVRAEYEAWPD